MARIGVGAALGARIRARREALRWSQATLAEAVDLTPNYIGSLERGESLPTVQTLVLFAKVLGTSPAALLGEPGGHEEWIDQLVILARTVPAAQRRLVLALIRAVVTESAGAVRTRRPRGARRAR